MWTLGDRQFTISLERWHCKYWQSVSTWLCTASHLYICQTLHSTKLSTVVVVQSSWRFCHILSLLETDHKLLLEAECGTFSDNVMSALRSSQCHQKWRHSCLGGHIWTFGIENLVCRCSKEYLTLWCKNYLLTSHNALYYCCSSIFMPFMRPRQQFIALEAVVINTLGYNLPQTQITVNPHLNWRNA